MQFIDECLIQLKAGNGGNGVVSWRREANVPYGGPYGGDGGDGGDIILVGDANTNTLLPLRNHKLISAKNGENGRTKIEFGKRGDNVYVKVPLGTVAYNAETGKQICEILKHKEEFIIAEGGRGGHGNWWFKNAENKIPTLHERGDVTEPIKVKLVIKYMADIGLVGLPNAGKSTLIGALTKAKPRTANYQFTTLEPVLGICEIQDEKITFVDLPGLIEGAAEGKGLGHEFLKHIERCSMLIHLVSLNPEDNDDVVHAYESITNELKLYNEALVNKPILIVANKLDIANADKQLELLKKKIKKPIIAISALKKQNLEELLDDVVKMYLKHKEEILKKAKTKSVKVIEVKKQKDYSQDLEIIQVDEHVWEIKSEYLKYWSNRIPLDNDQNIMRYNDKLKILNVENKVKAKGGIVGDTLRIYGNEMVLE
ncbi:MAG: GTPase ObgE [Malacoplasma sp.]|nr:GTPase ObgE [Malacoplasma sp.]